MLSDNYCVKCDPNIQVSSAIDQKNVKPHASPYLELSMPLMLGIELPMPPMLPMPHRQHRQLNVG